MRPVLVVGARGHARAVVEVIRAEARFSVAGLIDSYQAVGTPCFGYEVLGGEKDLPRIAKGRDIQDVIIAIGDNYQRAAMAHRLREAVPGLRLPSCIHPSAVVAADVVVDGGTVVMPGVVAVSGSRIGAGCILNTSCSLDHDGVMEDWSSLGPGVVVGGRLHLGERSAVNLGAKVIHGIRIGRDTLIGAGALVLEDMPDNVVAHGTPCRVVRRRAPNEPYL